MDPSTAFVSSLGRSPLLARLERLRMHHPGADRPQPEETRTDHSPGTVSHFPDSAPARQALPAIGTRRAIIAGAVAR